MSGEDKLILAKVLWMTAFQAVLNACKEEEISSEITVTAMVEVMTTVMKQLLGVEE